MKGVGFILGVLVGWAAVITLNEAGTRMAQYRVVQFRTALDKTLPWMIAIIAVALVLGLLLGVKNSFGAGALVGAGLLMTGIGVLVQVLPVRDAAKLTEWFELPGGRRVFGYTLWDGSALFVGVVLLVIGLMRWRSADNRPTPAYPGGPYPYQQAQGQFPAYQPGQPPQYTSPNNPPSYRPQDGRRN